MPLAKGFLQPPQWTPLQEDPTCKLMAVRAPTSGMLHSRLQGMRSRWKSCPGLARSSLFHHGWSGTCGRGCWTPTAELLLEWPCGLPCTRCRWALQMRPQIMRGLLGWGLS